jgi:NitT/TauT family transport system substrate-binding protein
MGKGLMVRRILVSSIVVLAIGAAAGCSSSGSSASSSSSSSSTATTTLTDYVGGATTSAPQDWAAQDQGIYAKYHLKVKFVDLSGTSQAVQAVAADKSGLAFTEGDIADEMLIESQNPSAPALISVAATEQPNPVALFFLKSSGITKPSDLVGKTIGVPSGSLSEEYLDAFLRTEGVPQDKVTIENITFDAEGASLLGKKVQAIAEFVRGLGSLRLLAQPRGEQIGTFTFGKYNIASPLAGVIVQQSLVDKHPAVAKAIAQASTEALYFCVTNQSQCIKDFVAANAGDSYTDSLAEWQVAITQGYGWNPATVAKENPLQLGYISPALVAKTVPELQKLFSINKTFDPTTLYTNQYMESPGT